MSYKVVSFDQFPMKSGNLPVSSMSDAHLKFLRKFDLKNNFLVKIFV